MSRAPLVPARRGLALAALLACLHVSACGGDDDDTAPDAASADAASQPILACQPATATTEDLCTCMAAIVCDQIEFCLDAEALAAKPDSWRPRSSCVESLESDCLEDAASDPADYLPADFPACVSDLGAATCADFGAFESVSADFPATCENLRALDTGLGIAL
jgi:hypothetical protein